MEEISKLLAPVIVKIGDFFELFDLSFFISGVLTISALVYFIFNFFGIPIRLDQLANLSNFIILLLTILCYIVGIVSWVAGKAIRSLSDRIIFKLCFKCATKFKEDFSMIETAFETNDKENKLFKKYKETNNLQGLYEYLWAELRETPSCTNSFSLVRRYWVQTAMLDGLVFSFLSWAIVLSLLKFLGYYSKTGYSGLLFFFTITLIGFIICGLISEAKRYKRYQKIELVNTYIKIKMDEAAKVPLTPTTAQVTPVTL